MNKVIIGIIIAGVLVGFSLPTLADTSTTSLQTLIRQLRQGMRGDDIKTLQAILAADPDIYPEGLITGFYGSLTTKAVKKFQKKMGFEQVGYIGPKTIKELNKNLEKNPLITEETENGKQLCAIVPPGHLIAPGWLKKQGNVKPIVPTCQVLPPGIAKKLGIATSTPATPDTTAPVISQTTATSTTATSTRITWLTNEPANSAVFYSTSTPVVVASSTPSISSSSLVTSHDILLQSLIASSTYYYFVSSSDSKGNTSSSSQASFITLPQ